MKVENNAKLLKLYSWWWDGCKFLNLCAVLDFDHVMEAPKFPLQ